MWRSRGFAAALVGAVVAAVLGLRGLGLLQGLELAIYDQWVRHASRAGGSSSTGRPSIFMDSGVGSHRLSWRSTGPA